MWPMEVALALKADQYAYTPLLLVHTSLKKEAQVPILFAPSWFPDRGTKAAASTWKHGSANCVAVNM